MIVWALQDPDRVTAPNKLPRQLRKSIAVPLAAQLRKHVGGEILFDAFSCGRYATDASIYQLEPLGIVVPRNEDAARAAIQIAAERGVPILPRGAGTSQCGQAVGVALVIDCSKYLNNVVEVDIPGGTATVQPGVVLDQLNALLRPHGWWFPVDVSTSAQATIGGMAGNNSCGARSIRYGNMVHNVAAIDACLADGTKLRLGPVGQSEQGPPYRDLVMRIETIVKREAQEIALRWPRVLRRVQGYNIDLVHPGRDYNLAHLLVGSEGTLAFSQRLNLQLARLPAHKVLGVVHFSSFYEAMEHTQKIVALDPDAVELVDRNMIDLARAMPAFDLTVRKVTEGDPEAILLVEFAGENYDEQLAKLKQLVELMADFGFGVVEITDPVLQKAVWEVRKAGLNIMMSMKGDGKPVSFVEDCAVPLEHLAEYTHRLNEVFEKHGTRGTWYAHASVGTLHVRPILDMRRDGAKKMRAIAEEACAIVKEYKGAAFSGEHGDGLVRSEWIEPIIGSRLTAALAEIKRLFDPNGVMNPGKIVQPSRMDDRSLFRYKPGYRVASVETALDWSEWGGLGAAVEMCNNNGYCRKFDAGTMCPSFRATRDEQHLTRGRANTLRLVLSGQLGDGALSSQELHDTMALCVSCKGCKRECPTGVDMARMKTEFLHHYTRHYGLSLRQRAIAWLPRYAPLVSRFASVVNFCANRSSAPALLERLFGLSRYRSLPRWSKRALVLPRAAADDASQEVVLLTDTFNRWFEPENHNAAVHVLEAAGYTLHLASSTDGKRPLCCGRTFLACGLVDHARSEAARTIRALLPYVERGCPVVGLEPSCLLTLRDEYLVMNLGADAERVAERSFLFEEFVAKEVAAGRFKLALSPLTQKAVLHGHCHQKAFDLMDVTRDVLALVPGLEVKTIQSSCCGMAGNFGYEKEHYEVSMKMAQTSLLPALSKETPDTLVIADGISCRHQIRDGSGRNAVHVAEVLRRAIKTAQA
ncbi:MAG: FAD-binding protein [Burkholderiales bacterium]|nr:FAD-binding protein [Burkholderiales bacterium]